MLYIEHGCCKEMNERIFGIQLLVYGLEETSSKSFWMQASFMISLCLLMWCFVTNKHWQALRYVWREVHYQCYAWLLCTQALVYNNINHGQRTRNTQHTHTHVCILTCSHNYSNTFVHSHNQTHSPLIHTKMETEQHQELTKLAQWKRG